MREPRAEQRVLPGQVRCCIRTHRDRVAGETVLTIPGDRNPLGSLGEEPVGERPPVTYAAVGEEALRLLGVRGTNDVYPVVARTLPAKAPLDRGVVDQMGQLNRDQWIAALGTVVEMVGDSTPQLALPVRVPLAEVRLQDLAHQLVQGQSVTHGLGEG